MPTYKIIPTNKLCATAEIDATDAGPILALVDRLGCEEADVLKDGTYSFSVSLGKNLLWSIFQRDAAEPRREFRSIDEH